ncbi:MAG: hypothetical protein ACRDE6_05830 [Candidatus Limnocylindria bacterium]
MASSIVSIAASTATSATSCDEELKRRDAELIGLRLVALGGDLGHDAATIHRQGGCGIRCPWAVDWLVGLVS